MSCQPVQPVKSDHPNINYSSVFLLTSTPFKCWVSTIIKPLSLKALNTHELAYIFRSDPQEEKTANRNWDYSVSLTPTACPH